MHKILTALTLALILPARAEPCPTPATLDPAYTQTGIHGFGDGLLAVEKNGRWGFINRQGRLVIPAEYEETNGFAESKAAVKLDGLWGVIDTSGKLLVQPRYQSAHRYFSGLLPVSKNGKNFIALDHRGHETALPLWHSVPPTPLIHFHSDDLKKTGYKDHSGNIVVPARYDKGERHFSDDMAAVKKGEHWGFIDADGNERIAPRYTIPSGQWRLTFNDGLAKVALDGQTIYIDKQGCTILQSPNP
ncbi:MAG: WG repeat-containing protein [Cardiobacteriaceae bacterium]|nr:WG repeat-containing protein [Cardiobacteriaceae bacterium]